MILLADAALAALVAAFLFAVYALGKTFFWPTMLAVVSERFPRGGAVTLSAIGGVGMLSAGFLGAPGIGQDSGLPTATPPGARHTKSTRWRRDRPSVPRARTRFVCLETFLRRE